MTVVTRFAPSPTGDLHLGHAHAAHVAWRLARAAGGRFLVRIEDIDQARCREAFVGRNLDDLAWLGLDWETPVIRQSARYHHYLAALDRLRAAGLLYPCFCTRRAIAGEIAAAAAAPQAEPGEAEAIRSVPPVYPGTCRRLDPAVAACRAAAGEPHALRLDAKAALARIGPLTWTDLGRGEQALSLAGWGDVVVARRELATSYHLAVVVDDAAQGVTHITRGADLFAASHVHRLLYALLALPPPVWHHHRLCVDAAGRRLAKRTPGLTLRDLRGRGLSPAAVLAMAEAAATGSDATA
jgi:glutamyl-Q tRNA(Asp) synthetase